MPRKQKEQTPKPKKSEDPKMEEAEINRLAAIERENRFYNLYYYYRGLSKPELEVWAPSPSHWQTILSPGYLQV